MLSQQVIAWLLYSVVQYLHILLVCVGLFQNSVRLASHEAIGAI